jgi:hypothetical protein
LSVPPKEASLRAAGEGSNNEADGK